MSGLSKWLVSKGWKVSNQQFLYQDLAAISVYSIVMITYSIYMYKIFRKNKDMYNRYNLIICCTMLFNIFLRIFSLGYFIKIKNVDYRWTPVQNYFFFQLPWDCINLQIWALIFQWFEVNYALTDITILNFLHEKQNSKIQTEKEEKPDNDKPIPFSERLRAT